MGKSAHCDGCGQPMDANAPGGLCAACLMKVGLGTGTGATATGAMEHKASAPIPPSWESLAQKFPQYEILEFIGQGGMGAVYKARQKSLDRLVALKILVQRHPVDPKFAERFALEARTLARLNHPNIISVFDYGETEGLCYLVMEYVEGLNLRQLITTQKLSPHEALAIVPELCSALQYAHELGIVHRDIKPENIMLDRQGRVKIADFGLAKLLGVASAPQRLTQAKEVMGTPHYMAPEQIEHPQAVDHRADIFSLGVVFYEMLTGELPLGKFAPPSRKVHLDVRLDEVVLRALEKEPERRYQQANEVSTDLATIVNGSSHEIRAVAKEKSTLAPSAASAPQPPTPVSKRTLAIIWPTFLLHLIITLTVAVWIIRCRPVIDSLIGESVDTLSPSLTIFIHDLIGYYPYDMSNVWVSPQYMLLPALLILSFDFLMCYLTQDLWGKRGLRLWSTLVITVLVSAGALVTIAFLG